MCQKEDIKTILENTYNDTYEKVKEVTECILKANGVSDKDKAKNWLGNNIFDEVEREVPGAFTKNTFLQYLSNAVRDDQSLISCTGKRQGYYLLDKVLTEQEVEKLIESDASVKQANEVKEVLDATVREKEKLLYPILVNWLEQEGYQASDISASRKQNKWGNPDIGGIKITDNFNSPEIEIVTIEAKTSLASWEQYVFEAVSHRRFANRSYFAFAHAEEQLEKLPKEMRYYADLYNVGILVIKMPIDKFTNFLAGRVDIINVNDEEIEVQELYSAPYNFVMPQYQVEFRKDTLRIADQKKLYEWGRLQD